MSIFPKIEKITLDTSVSHFLLMFGYKLFSLYFPLFLIWRGLSLPEVGYTYLLIYLPIAVFAPLVGFFSHKISPVILAVLGILGYGVYCLGMIFLPISFFAIKRIGKLKSSKNIFQGAAISGILSIVLGGLGVFANFYTIFLVKFGQSISGLMSGSGRSGLLSQKLKEHPEEAGAIDTIFSPLGVALGSLVAGLIIGFLGFSNLFILGGIFVVAVAVIGRKLMQKI